MEEFFNQLLMAVEAQTALLERSFDRIEELLKESGAAVQQQFADLNEEVAAFNRRVTNL